LLCSIAGMVPSLLTLCVYGGELQASRKRSPLSINGDRGGTDSTATFRGV
jgi:hypothetical protein